MAHELPRYQLPDADQAGRERIVDRLVGGFHAHDYAITRAQARDRLLRAVDGFVGLGRFEDPRFPDRLRLAQQNGELTGGDLVDGTLGVARGAITVAGFAATLVVLSPVLAAVVLLSGVPTVVAELVLSRRRARMYWTIGPAQRREVFYAQLLTTVAAAKEMRLFGAGRYLRHRVLADRRTANAAIRAVDRRAALVQTGLALLTSLIAGGGLLWATAAAGRGRLSVGDVVIFVAAAAGVQGALVSVAADVARAHFALQMLATSRTSPRPVPTCRPWYRPGRCRRCGTGSSCVTCGSATPTTTPGCCAASTCSSRTDPRSPWSAATARESPRWWSCCAASTTPPAARSCGTASTCASWTRWACAGASARCSRTTWSTT